MDFVGELLSFLTMAGLFGPPPDPDPALLSFALSLIPLTSGSEVTFLTFATEPPPTDFSVNFEPLESDRSRIADNPLGLVGEIKCEPPDVPNEDPGTEAKWVTGDGESTKLGDPRGVIFPNPFEPDPGFDFVGEVSGAEDRLIGSSRVIAEEREGLSRGGVWIAEDKPMELVVVIVDAPDMLCM